MPARKIPFSIDPRGTITFTPTDPPRPPGRYVFQRVHPGLGNVAADPTKSLQLRSYVIPADPKTPVQRARRLVFSIAVNNWKLLTDEEKKAWNKHGAKRAISGICSFISTALKV